MNPFYMAFSIDKQTKIVTLVAAKSTCSEALNTAEAKTDLPIHVMEFGVDGTVARKQFIHFLSENGLSVEDQDAIATELAAMLREQLDSIKQERGLK